MTNERLTTLLYNALTYLTDINGTDFEELEEELGITEDEYKQIVEDYQDTICCTFGKDELRESFFSGNEAATPVNSNLPDETHDKKVEQIVNYIVDTACKNTETGEWSIYPENVCEDLGISADEYIELHGDVVEELCKRDEIVDLVDVGNGDLDLGLDVDYCKKFEGRIYEYKNGELTKKASLSDKIKDAQSKVVESSGVEAPEREER